MSNRPSATSGGIRGILFAVGAVALAVICCAGPVLIAGGGLALAGGVIGNPAVLAIGALVVAGAVAFTVSRRRARARANEVPGGQSEGGSSVAEVRAPKMADCCDSQKTGANSSVQQPGSRDTSSANGRNRRP